MRSTVVKWHVTYFGNPGSKGSIKKHRPFGTVFLCGTYKMQSPFPGKGGDLRKIES